MTEQQVDKFIRDMRGVFIFVSVLQIIVAVLFHDSVIALVRAIFAICFIATFLELGKRTKTSLVLARVSSIIFLLGFPVETYFGIRYLIKLAKPEVQQTLSN